ncbi:MAG TPA: site-2 protease family protein, partial [Anaeromyxobacteraceae bacterium]|nr:site-2 protease family protein [Anaeromyxobacteraceae bacterium]
MESAVFRPALRSVRRTLLLGALGGAALGFTARIPILLAALFGAVAAVIAVSVRHVRGVRLVADEAGVAVRGADGGLAARWEELRVGFGRSMREDGVLQRYAILGGPRGRCFAFANFAGAPPCEPVLGLDGARVPVVDLGDAALLLAVVVQRVPAWHVLPEELREAPGPIDAVAPLTPSLSPRDAGGEGEKLQGEKRPRASVGLLAILAKLGGTAVKALKTANVGWAAASAAAYGFLFSWKFAAALLVQLFVHEYGHVHAMRRTGMRVRGMYFVPFLGAMAVTDDAFTSRRQQAYVALAGPLWGALFSLVPAGLWLWTQDPMWAAIASWWAIINLFNLLPIAPLDGGRVMQSFAYSFSSTLGVAVTVLGLAGAVAAGTALGYSLVWLVAALGAMELLAESRSRAGGRALRLLPERSRFGLGHWRWLRAVAGPAPSEVADAFFERELARMEATARAEPMRPWQIAAWGLAYAALAAGLIGLVRAMS